MGPDADQRGGRKLGARVPTPQPARPVPDPSGHSRGPRRCAHRRVHRLVADHRPLRPALRSASQPHRCPEPVGGRRQLHGPIEGLDALPRSTRPRLRTISRTTRPAPTCSRVHAATPTRQLPPQTTSVPAHHEHNRTRLPCPAARRPLNGRPIRRLAGDSVSIRRSLFVARVSGEQFAAETELLPTMGNDSGT